MNTYSLSELAVEDLNNICEFIAQNSVKSASKLFDAIRQKCKLVAGFPNMGKSYELLANDLRGFFVDDYIIFYYPRQDGIDVVRIAYGKRDLESLFEEIDETS